MIPASGVRGILHRDAEGACFFRVYAADGTFVDYDLRHDDLPITIDADAMAAFYHVGDDRVLDHSPQVLGLDSVD